MSKKSKPRRKRLLCPCGTCKWCYRCNRWFDARHHCTHNPIFRLRRGKVGVEGEFAND